MIYTETKPVNLSLKGIISLLCAFVNVHSFFVLIFIFLCILNKIKMFRLTVYHYNDFLLHFHHYNG